MGEKRIHPRLDLPLQADLLVEGSKRRATLENLSAGGAGLRMTEQLAPGTRVDEIDFTLPANGKSSGFQVATQAEIVHAVPVSQPEGDGGYLTGLRFIDLPENQFRSIQQFIFERLTKGSPESSEIPLERRRVTLERPISIRFERFDEFVSQMAENISLGGMFIRTDAPKPPGTVFSFKFQLGDDFSLVEGEAEVIWTRQKSLGPTQHAGMGIRFLDLDERSRNTILSLVKKKTAGASAVTKPTPKLRVAAVIPKSRPASPASAAGISGRQAARTKVATPASGEADDSRIAKLRQELGRRTRAYEARITALERRIEELTARQVEEGSGKAGDGGARAASALVEFEETRSRVELERTGSEDPQTANRQIATLRKELAELTAELETDRRKRGSLENKLLAVEQALRSTEKERDEISSRLAESSEFRRKLQAELDAIAADDASSAEEDLRRELAEAVDRNRTFEERIAVALRDRDEALGKLTLISTTETSVRKVTEEAELVRQELLSELGQTQDQLARTERAHEDRLAELREEVEEAKRAAEETRLRAEDEETARREAESRLDQVHAELERERSERASLGEQLETELRAALSQAGELEEEVVHLEASLENAAQSRQEHEQALARAEDELESVRAEQEELVAGFRTETEKAVTAAHEMAAEREELAASLENSERERGRLEETVTEIRAELEHAMQDRQAMESELRAELEEAVNEAHSEAERLIGEHAEQQAASREEVEAVVSAREALELQLVQLEASLEDVARGRQEVGSALARAEDELEHVRVEHEELVAALRAEAQEAASRVGELERAVEERQAVESELRQELETTLVSRGELEETLAGVRSELDDLRAEHEEQVAALTARAEESGSRVGELERVVEEGQAVEAELRQELAATLAGRGELEEALARMRSELDGAAAEHQEQLVELRVEAEESASALTDFRALTDELKSSLETSEHERRELDRSLSESRVEFEQLTEERDKLESELRRELEERAGELEKSLEEADVARRDLARQLEDLEARNRETEAALLNAETEREDTANIEAEHREQIVALEALLQEAERKHEKVGAKLVEESQAAQETEETLRSRIEERRTEIEHLGQDREEAQNRVKALEIELDKVQTVLSEHQTGSRETETGLREELGEALGLKGRFEDRTKELEELLRAEQARHESMTADLEQSVASGAALQAEKKTLQSVIDALKGELENTLGRTPVEIEELVSRAAAAREKAPRRRWLRAAGLVGVGLLTGALLGGPGSQFLPAELNPGSWFGAKTVAASERAGQVPQVAGDLSAGSGAPASEETAESLLSTIDSEPSAAIGAAEEPVPREAPSPPPARVVTAWADAWSQQRVDDYLSFYSPSFVPSNGADRSEWEAYRRDRVSSPASIEITLGEITESELDGNRVSMTFSQAYRAGAYSDRVMKTLVLVREDGGWKILSEVSEALE